MKSLLFGCVLLACAPAACGGNYSNSDLDYQIALPDTGEIAAAPPLALADEQTAEFLKETQKTIATFNTISTAFLSLIDHVRRYPATKRVQDQRIWGPFPDEHIAGWWLRIVMTRITDQRFDYYVQLTATPNVQTSWINLMWGFFDPSHGVSGGAGELRIDTMPARNAGYMVDRPGDDDLNKLRSLNLVYNRKTFPISITMDLRDVDTPEPDQVHFEYIENADRSGSMLFEVPVVDQDLRVQSIELRSRWLSTGQGRTDAKVTFGTAANLTGIECWDQNGHGVYGQLAWEPTNPKRNYGTASACAL